MSTVHLDIRGEGKASIEVQSDADGEAMGQALSRVADLAKALLDLEETIDKLPEDLPQNRLRALMAVNMKAVHHLQEALTLAHGAIAVAAGDRRSRDFGFPEFDDEATTSIAD